MGEYEPLLGDVDGDTYVSVLDATVIQRVESQLCDIDEKALEYADVDNDQKVSVLDATQIQKSLIQ